MAPLAVLLGWLLLGEAPPVIALPGGLLCLGGVALTQFAPRRPAAHPAQAPASSETAAEPRVGAAAL